MPGNFSALARQWCARGLYAFMLSSVASAKSVEPLIPVWKTVATLDIGTQSNALRLAEGPETIFGALHEGYIFSLDQQSGSTKWIRCSSKTLSSLAETAELFSGVIYSKGQLFVGSESGILYCLNAEDGKVNWSQDLGYPLLSAPLVQKNWVAIVNYGGEVCLLDRFSGKIKWKAQIKTKGIAGMHEASEALENLAWYTNPTPFALNDNSISVQNELGVIETFDIDSGDRLASAFSFGEQAGANEQANTFYVPPVKEGKTVYFASGRGPLEAWEQVGQEDWEKTFTLPLGSTTALGIDQDYLYLLDNDNHLHAISRKDGSILWRLDLPQERKFGCPQVWVDQVVLLDEEGTVYLIDKAVGTCSAVKSLESVSSFPLTPLVSQDNELLVVPLHDGSFKAFKWKPNA